MRRLLPTLLLALGLLLAALLTIGCASGSTAGASGHSIDGTVLAGPTCPVERPDSPCPPRPWSGTVRATAADGTTYDGQADANGRFAIDGLPDGTYVVSAVTASTPPIATPQTVRVHGSDVTVDLAVDTGIR